VITSRVITSWAFMAASFSGKRYHRTRFGRLIQVNAAIPKSG